MFSLRFWAVMTTSSTAAEVGSVGAESGASRAVSAAAEGAAAHIATTKAAAQTESRRIEGLLAHRPGRLTFSTHVNELIAPSKNSRLRKRRVKGLFDRSGRAAVESVRGPGSRSSAKVPALRAQAMR